MSRRPPTVLPAPPVTLRRAGLALALATLAAAVIGTQWPFEYRLTAYAVRFHWDHIDWSWFPRDRAGRVRLDTDLAINLLMLVPLGAGFGLWRRARPARVVCEAALLGAATGAALELAQLVTHERYTSFADAWRNAAGCLAGAVVAVALLAALARRRA